MRNVCIITDQESIFNISLIFCHILTTIIVFILMWRISKSPTFDNKRILLKKQSLNYFRTYMKIFFNENSEVLLQIIIKIYHNIDIKIRIFFIFGKKKAKNYWNTASIFFYWCDLYLLLLSSLMIMIKS